MISVISISSKYQLSSAPFDEMLTTAVLCRCVLSAYLLLGHPGTTAAAQPPHKARSLQVASCDNLSLGDRMPQDPCEFDDEQAPTPIYYTALNFGHTHVSVGEIQDYIVQQMSNQWSEVSPLINPIYLPRGRCGFFDMRNSYPSRLFARIFGSIS